MEMTLNNGFYELTMDENVLINGGITTADVAAAFVTAAGAIVGGVIGNAVGGPIGAAVAGQKGATYGAFLGALIVGGVAETTTVTIINNMSSN